MYMELILFYRESGQPTPAKRCPSPAQLRASTDTHPAPGSSAFPSPLQTKQIRQQRFHAVKRRFQKIKRIRQQHRQTLRIILFRCLFTFKIDAGYIRFAQALLNQLAFADAPASINQADLHPFIQKQTMQILALLFPSVEFHLLGHLRLGLVRVYYAVDNRKNNHLKNSK